MIHKKNEGVSIARKTGIENSKGLYILFLDSDDKYNQTLLEKLFYKIQEQQPDLLIFGFKRIKETDGCVIKEVIPSNTLSVKQLLTDQMELTFLLWNKCYKKKLFSEIDINQINGITFSEDSWLSFNLIFLSKKIIFLPFCGYNYLCRKTSVTQTMSYKNRIDYIKAISLLDNLYTEKKEEPEVLQKIKSKAKFAQINPDYDYSIKDFIIGCKIYNKNFLDVNKSTLKFAQTKLMKLYLVLIEYRLYIPAFILYKLRKRRIQK